MAFIDWLRDQHRASEASRTQFGARPTVAASQAWKGYQDPQGGQNLMVRQREPLPRAPNPLIANISRAAPNPLATNIPGNVPGPFRPTFDPRSGVSPSQNYGPTGGFLGTFPTSLARPDRVSQVDQIRAAIHERPIPDRAGSRADQWAMTPWPWMRDQRREDEFLPGVSEKGMWDLIVAALSDKWKGVKKGKKKIQSRIDRNRVRRARPFDYEGGESGPGTGADKTGVQRVYDFTPSSAGWRTKREY